MDNNEEETMHWEPLITPTFRELVKVFTHTTEDNVVYEGWYDPEYPHLPVVVADYVDEKTFGEHVSNKDKALNKLLLTPLELEEENKENSPPIIFWDKPALEIYSYQGNTVRFKETKEFPAVTMEYLQLHNLSKNEDIGKLGYYKSNALTLKDKDVIMSIKNPCFFPDEMQIAALLEMKKQEETFFFLLSNKSNYKRTIDNMKKVNGGKNLNNVTVCCITEREEGKILDVKTPLNLPQLAKEIIDIKKDIYKYSDCVSIAAKDLLEYMYASSKKLGLLKKKVHFPFYYDIDRELGSDIEPYDLSKCKRIVFSDIVTMHLIYGRSSIAFVDIYVIYEKFLIELEDMLDLIKKTH